MKFLQLRITHTGETIHEVHEFEMRHDDLHGSELVHWNPSLGETNSMVFRVEGDPDAYRDVLEERDDTLAYSIAPTEDGAFYCCVCERLTERDRLYVDAFARGTLVVVPPVSYNQDGTIDVTVVGAASDIDDALDTIPEEVGVEALSIGDYRRRAAGAAGLLTDRQREAVAAAVDCGYYDSPRRGAVSDVAAELDVTPSTAAEHLRKAETRVMRRILGRA